jgi:dTDP-4-dehydrorhamnose 3,5-epimerase-like enzyme
VLEAIREEDEKHIRSSAPRAIRALSSLIENPKANDHARGIAMALDRVHLVETIQKVAGEHQASSSIKATCLRTHHGARSACRRAADDRCHSGKGGVLIRLQEPEVRSTAYRSAWQATWNDDEELIVHMPPGYRHDLISISWANSPDLRLRFIEILHKLVHDKLTVEAMQRVEPVRDTAMKMLDKMKSLSAGDKFKLMMRWNVMAALINLNPSILEARKLFSFPYEAYVKQVPRQLLRSGPRKDKPASFDFQDGPAQPTRPDEAKAGNGCSAQVATRQPRKPVNAPRTDRDCETIRKRQGKGGPVFG